VGAASNPSGTQRVLALLAPGGTLPEIDAPVELVRAESGYEAAAELLSAPVAALVVHLGRITPAHVRLLDLAAELEVPVLAFGTISAPLSSAQLARMRMVEPKQLGPALKELLSGTASPAASGDGQYAPQPPASPARGLTRAELEALLEENP